MLLSEFSTRLSSEGLVMSGYVVIEGKLPATPDKVIALYEYGGSGPELFLSGSATVEVPNVQVVTRGGANDATTPRQQAERIFHAAMNWGAFTVNGVRYLGVTPTQSPFPLNRDANERATYAVNFRVQKELSATP